MTGRAWWAVAGVTLMTFAPLVVLAADGQESEPPESAVSSPPMEMDDPGTPGAQGVEINFVGSMTRVGHGRSAESLFDANYGIGDRIQLKYERPYVMEGDVGGPWQQGVGATELGVKWRAMDSHGFELAVYPQYQFDDGFVLKDEEGLPEESEGRSVYLPVLMSERVREVYTVAANLGYRRNLDGRGDDVNLAVGGGRALGENARVLAEVFSERDEQLHNRQTDVRAGFAFLLFPKQLAHSKVELPAYASVGHSIGATESGENSTSVTFGVSFIVKPKGE